MEHTLNHFLSMFSAPYVVGINEDMSMTVTFSDGTILPAERLSLGQRMMLSVSMVFAEAELFCPNVGVLFLDEPTLGLDEDNRANICELFSAVRTATENSGSQVFLITHETALQDVADRAIRVGL